MKSISSNPFLPGIAWFFVVLILICLPGNDIPHVDDWFKKIYFDKMVHAVMFGLMAFLFMKPVARFSISHRKKWHYFIAITLAICVWGLVTEFIQKYLIPGRTFDLNDWAADSAGAIITMLFSKRYFLK